MYPCLLKKTSDVYPSLIKSINGVSESDKNTIGVSDSNKNVIGVPESDESSIGVP